ncbi:mechanosensitive ion channel protein MscS [Terasakiella brassicae]|uniref:Mechanosensitive ion channel protein MscS n=1 Tax=Terasakiella brassicae TaxID=1634917 RepID=A0A917FA14_9PROT|nr:mechanosensitive ion channel domain-containing protein [Terasakiella brassicae]GGF61002.1 mechanosensitive ion channel protein MscS [Terasakiella brassicae]
MFELIEQLSGNQIMASLIFMAAMLAVRFISNSWLNSRSKMEVEDRRRIKSNIKNGLFLVVLIALIFIWAPALRTFALSLTAFAVAIILATKELILCISGYILKSTSGLIRVGDWIEIGDLRGEVVDQNIMTTSLEELGHGHKKYEYSGRTVLVPNSLFLSTTVKNERFNKRYTYHNFNIVLHPEIPLGPIRDKLLGILTEETEQYAEVAKRYKALIEKRADIPLSDAFIDSRISFLDDTHVRLTFICFVPVAEASRIENKIKTMASAEIADWYARKAG